MSRAVRGTLSAMSDTSARRLTTGPWSAVTLPVALLRDGYLFWEGRRRRTGGETVQARLLTERATAVRGADAAHFFYGDFFDGERATERSSALPMTQVGALFGRGPVHTLDGAQHAHRKAVFNGLLGAEAARDVTTGLAARWDERAPRWSGAVDVFDEIGPMLLEVGCDWAGIPLADDEIAGRTRDMLAMVDGFGAPSGRQLRARRARRRTDAWSQALVEESRRSPADAGPPRPLDVVARHRDEHGRLLPAHTAAVEVVNLIRPLVAVSWLVAGLFEALDVHPRTRDDVLAERVSTTNVAQEVRRTYPFVPFLAARATRDLSWDGVAIPAGTLVVLDVWGTNHDPRIWRDPDAFDPSRFQRTPVTPYNLVPQGGGSREGGHRCPGEDVTLAVLGTLVDRVAALRYRVVGPRAQLRRMPPRPRLLVHAGR
ncbi:MAG: cytochrome [Aeromicrobium sp.]|nr:cytochrome [Aeromicrobium sp.]